MINNIGMGDANIEAFSGGRKTGDFGPATSQPAACVCLLLEDSADRLAFYFQTGVWGEEEFGERGGLRRGMEVRERVE